MWLPALSHDINRGRLLQHEQQCGEVTFPNVDIRGNCYPLFKLPYIFQCNASFFLFVLSYVTFFSFFVCLFHFFYLTEITRIPATCRCIHPSSFGKYHQMSACSQIKLNYIALDDDDGYLIIY